MAALPGSLLYAAAFLGVALGLVPGIFWLTALASRRVARLSVPVGRLFVDYAYCLVPLGLAGWIAFTGGFVFVNGSYAASVVSDPFGWGWDLFGTRFVAWRPVLTSVVPSLQVGLLLLGLAFSVVTAYRIGRQHAAAHVQAWRATVPVSGFLTATTMAFLWLYLG
jgi:hypothetical protein